MKKLITYPKKIDTVLKEYKEKTGMSVSSYILRAIYKQLVSDELINIKTTDISCCKECGKIVEKNGK